MLISKLVYRPRLVRRLERLEKKLQVDPDDRHVCDRTLKAAKEVYIRGTRLNPKPSVSVGDDKSLVQRDVGGSNWFQANSIASRVGHPSAHYSNPLNISKGVTSLETL